MLKVVFQNTLQVKNEHLDLAFKQNNNCHCREKRRHRFNKANGRDMEQSSLKGVNVCFLNS